MDEILANRKIFWLQFNDSRTLNNSPGVLKLTFGWLIFAVIRSFYA